MDFTCKNYVGVSCIDGTCPMADMDNYIPTIKECKECYFNKGCVDCALSKTDYCEKKGV